MQNFDFIKEEKKATLDSEEVISFQTEIPKSIQNAMQIFIEEHPKWDQYRLMQAAIAGFLFQNGINSRLITRLYVSNMFGSHSF